MTKRFKLSMRFRIAIISFNLLVLDYKPESWTLACDHQIQSMPEISAK